MRSLMAVLVFVAAGCSGQSTIIEAKQYATSCSTAADCVGVFVGDACSVCRCPNAAISTSAKSRYDADRLAARAQCETAPAVECPCPDERAGACNNNVCELPAQ